MKALLLAAGFGTRLRPLTDSIPKCLVPVCGRPLMAYWLELLIGEGIQPVLVNRHYLANQVKDYIDESPYSHSVVTHYEEHLLGTAGTLLRHRDFFDGDRIFMAHGDNLSFFSMKDFLKSHENRPRGCEITMMTFEAEVPESCGIVELDDANVVRAFHEKVANPPGRLANGAVYIMEPSVLAFLESLGEEIIDFSTEVLPKYLGRIYTFHNDCYHRDIGTSESYEKAQKECALFQEQFSF